MMCSPPRQAGLLKQGSVLTCCRCSSASQACDLPILPIPTLPDARLAAGVLPAVLPGCGCAAGCSCHQGMATCSSLITFSGGSSYLPSLRLGPPACLGCCPSALPNFRCCLQLWYCLRTSAGGTPRVYHWRWACVQGRAGAGAHGSLPAQRCRPVCWAAAPGQHSRCWQAGGRPRGMRCGALAPCAALGYRCSGLSVGLCQLLCQHLRAPPRSPARHPQPRCHQPRLPRFGPRAA